MGGLVSDQHDYIGLLWTPHQTPQFPSLVMAIDSLDGHLLAGDWLLIVGDFTDEREFKQTTQHLLMVLFTSTPPISCSWRLAEAFW